MTDTTTTEATVEVPPYTDTNPNTRLMMEIYDGEVHLVQTWQADHTKPSTHEDNQRPAWADTPWRDRVVS